MGTPVSSKDAILPPIIAGIFGAVIAPLVAQVLVPFILGGRISGVSGGSFLWAAIGLGVGMLLGYFLRRPRPSPSREPSLVTIIFPAPGSRVPRLADFQGVASSHIPQGKELWLLVKPPDDPGYYPQPGPIMITVDGKWNANAYIGRDGSDDVGKKYTVYAALADQAGSSAIEHYFKSGHNQPLVPLPMGIQLISQVVVKRRK